MALTLIKEDGTGKVDANSYASVADGDAYHEGHLYATAWTGASEDTKAAALVMATRLIDVEYKFHGYRRTEAQALQWPRETCRDPDADGWNGGTVPGMVVPRNVREAACETARALILEDRTVNPPGEGLLYSRLGDLAQTYDKADRRPIVPQVAHALLMKFGVRIRGRSGSVPLARA